MTAGPARFRHDANGNLTSDGSTSFAYDTENRLVSASGWKRGTLRYDPMGRLLSTSGGSAGETRFLYDGDALVGEYSASGTLLRRYVHGAGVDEPVVWYEGSGLGDARFYHANHQGSIVAVAGNTGARVQTNAYDAYGIPNEAYVGEGRSPIPGRSTSPSSRSTTTRRGPIRPPWAVSCRPIRLGMTTRSICTPGSPDPSRSPIILNLGYVFAIGGLPGEMGAANSLRLTPPAAQPHGTHRAGVAQG